MKIYLAAPIINNEKQKETEIKNVYCALLLHQYEVYWPKMLKIPNAWGISQEAWAQSVFTVDVRELDQCDWIVVCDYGRYSTCGTAWETGYAFGIGKKILVIQMPGCEESSLMMHGCASNIIKYDDFFKEDATLFIERGRVQNNDIVLN